MKLVLILTIMCLFACQKDQKKVIAEVGDSAVTLAELKQHLPKRLQKNLGSDKILDLLSRWVEQEALFYEAKARDIENDPQFQKLLEQNRRKLMIDRLMQQELAQDFKPTKRQLKTFFQENRDQFLRDEAVFSYRTLTMPSATLAWQVRANISKTSFERQWNRYLPTGRFTPEQSANVLSSKVNSCLKGRLLPMKVQTSSSPVACGNTWVIVYADQKIPKGSRQNFAEVENQIAQIFQLQKSKEKIVTLVQKAKSKVPITTFLENLPNEAEEQTASSFIY